MRSIVVFAFILGLLALAHGPSPVRAQNNLVMVGGTMNLSGVHRYDNICLSGGATINVQSYAGGSKSDTGNLELIAGSIYISGNSKIVARGSGYQGSLCSDGPGPNTKAGGRGGCSVMDSGGGGAHFGRGGRGTVDDPLSTGNQWQMGFPTAFEDDCDINFAGPNCATINTSRTLCWQDGLDDATGLTMSQASMMGMSFTDRVGKSVAGEKYWHNIYDPEFGSAGGDRGCRDNDALSGSAMAGAGGGRVVLVGLSPRNPMAYESPCASMLGAGSSQGKVRIEGLIDANGKRGCGVGNDSGGGGGGGTVMVVGENVVVGPAAIIRAAGGLGGDVNAKASPDAADCPNDAQAAMSGSCDDCGGGGGGGIINILSVTSTLDPGAQFNVSGALGGVCTICNGEAGGGAGELQLDGAYVGEYCDDFDNDFDGNVDEFLPDVSCGRGRCARPIPACMDGAPVSCEPTVDANDASCREAVTNARPRVSLILDTSASMLLDLEGYPTFGDGSADHPGIDSMVDPDFTPNDSRLYLAREALAQVISAYPEIDFALARYHQDQGLNRSCQNAKWFECQGLVGTYDDPNGNTGTLSPACSVKIGPNMGNVINVDPIPGPAGSQCINYAGSCGAPRRGADVLAGFGTKVRDMVRWLDGREGPFSADITVGDVCRHSNGVNNCEVRGSGPTPLAGSLQAIEDYVAPIRATDPATACRGYSVILLTDGAESCNGDPAVAAQRLFQLGIQVYVVAVSVLASEEASLNGIARAGSGGARDATFVTAPEELVPALTEIIAGSIKFEECNGNDDDCDGKIDEGFPGLGTACDDGDKGVCKGEGVISCRLDGTGTECKLAGPGGTMGAEVCNSLDDDCDGKVDEMLTCDNTPCEPTGAEVCNGIDDDCNDNVDEADPMLDRECGETRGVCEPGRQRCVAGTLVCIGGVQPGVEICNGRDDDCDGLADDDAPCPVGNLCIDGACRRECDPTMEFPCPVGYLCKQAPNAEGHYCIPGACALCKSTELCKDDVCVDPCEGVECEDNQACVLGLCKDCTQVGCPTGQVCYERACRVDACATATCSDDQFCFDGECRPLCEDSQCRAGQRCNADGQCEADRCAGVTCDDGRVCRGGRCADDPCDGITCTLGDVCAGELGCVADPCVLTMCPRGAECTVSASGLPVCSGPTQEPRRPERYVSGGGSGLSTCRVGEAGSGSGSGSGSYGVLLAGLVLALRCRRRRWGKR